MYLCGYEKKSLLSLYSGTPIERYAKGAAELDRYIATPDITILP